MVTLSKHGTHYDPRSDFPYYNLTVPLPILSVRYGKAVLNESWTPSYLSRMWKVYGMSPGPHLICQAWENCME